MPIDPNRLEAAYQAALAALLAERNAEGHWTGELSTSALSTATAVAALALVQKHSPPADRFDHLITGGLAWLSENQNSDGGWGDTVKSFSNISTTMLCRAAFHLATPITSPQRQQGFSETLRRADAWLSERYGKTPEEQAEAVRARYGKDRTFAVPILTTCALAGLVSWKEVPSLPFELACLPQSWFRFLKLQVVSYALPALIAIGQAVHHHRPPWNPLSRMVRWLARRKSLKVLEAIQPSSGGYLEATPLTSFVTLSLASIGLANHPVAQSAVRFLVNAVRANGSWPIDSNLATWVTTLAINALHAAGELEHLERKDGLREWLLKQQYRVRHPYTAAEAGGWAWTDLPGGVPDADDTPGAILALQAIGSPPYGASKIGGKYEYESKPPWPFRSWARSDSERKALSELFARKEWTFNEAAVKWQDSIAYGLEWLVALQNRDGGWPTFCRGWGHLPFDRSGSDLTAHAVRAINRWKAHLTSALQLEQDETWERYGGDADFSFNFTKALAYLARQQRPDGSWLPLWFGNQHAPDDENPTYGTARVLAAYRDLHKMNAQPAQRGIAWLLSVQNMDGGWGGAKDTPSSIEESALAIEVLLDAGLEAADAVNKGLSWLVQQVETGGLYHPTPIGFYFAKLWYFEKLYPIIFSVAALGRARINLAAK